MTDKDRDIVVAGHLCPDLIPKFRLEERIGMTNDQ